MDGWEIAAWILGPPGPNFPASGYIQGKAALPVRGPLRNGGACSVSRRITRSRNVEAPSIAESRGDVKGACRLPTDNWRPLASRSVCPKAGSSHALLHSMNASADAEPAFCFATTFPLPHRGRAGRGGVDAEDPHCGMRDTVHTVLHQWPVLIAGFVCSRTAPSPQPSPPAGARGRSGCTSLRTRSQPRTRRSLPWRCGSCRRPRECRHSSRLAGRSRRSPSW